jgi:hypothetical protein
LGTVVLEHQDVALQIILHVPRTRSKLKTNWTKNESIVIYLAQGEMQRNPALANMAFTNARINDNKPREFPSRV